VFKQHKGITPYQFLLNEKIKIAKALLATTEMSVKSISDKLCFADEHYFSHLFKEKTGLSPLKYKAKKRMA
jgi:transcriptional regulator GlxA family with amidase domain